MTLLPTWMRRALYATAAMNLLGAALFLPGARALRDLAGMPPDAHALYLSVAGMFVLLFGAGYFWCAYTGRAERMFITLAAVGKTSFFLLMTGFWMAGELPVIGPLLASGDLFFAVLFFAWLAGVGPIAAPHASAAAARR